MKTLEEDRENSVDIKGSDSGIVQESIEDETERVT